MKQITNLAELPNKTILRTQEYYGEIFVFFTDETFCVFADDSVSGHNFENYVLDLTPDIFNCKKLSELGFITKDQCSDLVRNYQQKNRLLVEKNEIEKLKELKAKYPNI
jgi:hypothetical protein